MPQCLLMNLVNFIMQTYSFLTPKLLCHFANKKQDLIKTCHPRLWHSAKYRDLYHTLGKRNGPSLGSGENKWKQPDFSDSYG